MANSDSRPLPPETRRLFPPALPVSERASLFVQAESETRAVVLREGEPLVLGREVPADICINDPGVSRAHARFTLSESAVLVEDLGSTNGVLWAGKRVSRVVLECGDFVHLGSVRVVLAGTRPGSAACGTKTTAAFVETVRTEIDRARTFSRSFSLLAVRAALSSGPAFEQLAGLVRRVDVVTAHTPDLALVLLPETAPAEATELAREWLGCLGAGFGAAVVGYPEDATDLESLIDLAVHVGRSSAGQQVVRAPGVRSAPAPNEARVILSSGMRRLYDLIDRVARTTTPVLVLGETGVGKELVSRALHERSPRSSGPFVAINCGSIPAGLAASALFGHEKGAFTDARERRPGVFEQAHSGTVFLDEVGELDLSTQAALLRVVEQRRVIRVGGSREVEVDVRIVAATHRNLASMVANGTFREDLLFRLDVLTLTVPPLRERVEEIEPLAYRFLEKARQEWNTTPRSLAPEALALLRAHAYPGNVRELKNIVERAAIVCTDDEIGVDQLPDTVLRASLRSAGTEGLLAPADASFGPQSLPPFGESLEDRLRAYEAKLIEEALAATGGNQTKAAAMLRVARRTLAGRVQALGLSQISKF